MNTTNGSEPMEARVKVAGCPDNGAVRPVKRAGTWSGKPGSGPRSGRLGPSETLISPNVLDSWSNHDVNDGAPGESCPAPKMLTPKAT